MIKGGDPAAFVQHLYVERGCLDLPMTEDILKRWGKGYSVIGDSGVPAIPGGYPDNLSKGKRCLLLTKNRGRFFKPCPGTREYRCCGYQVLNIGMNCPMDCVYCILQAYLNNPWLSFYVNVDDMFAEMDRDLDRDPGSFFRIGTGEFTDSLALDSLTGLSPLLVRYMAGKSNAVLELKSKCVAIDNLEHLDHNQRTVVAWSLNSDEIMHREELRASTLEKRLEAAARCAGWGYHLAFHFDPVIFHTGWEEGYEATIERLFAKVPAEAIVWISLGALRYLPALKGIAGERFPHSSIFYQEFVEGLDGKARYFREHREVMYRHLAGLLMRHADPDTCLYFCMESDHIWRSVFGFIPEEKGGIAAMLDQAIQKKLHSSGKMMPRK